MKNFFAFSRFIPILCIWTYSYIYNMRNIFWQKWEFDILNSAAWQRVYKAWEDGWVIKESGETIFVSLLLGLIPFWLVGLVLCHKIKWLSPFKLLKRKKKQLSDKEIAEIVAKKAVNSANKRPPTHQVRKPTQNQAQQQRKTLPPRPEKDVMAVSEEVVSKQPEARPMPVEQAPVPKPVAASPTQSTNSIAATPTTTNSLPKEAMNIDAISPEKPSFESIPDMFKEFATKRGYIIYSNMPMGNHNIDLVLVSAKTIYLVALTPKGDEWVADEESFNDEPPVWFSEDDFEVSPVHRVLKAKPLLLEMLSILMPDDYKINVEAVVSIGRGVILNGSSMVKSWNEYGALVTKFAAGLPDILTNIEDVIPDISDNSDIPDDILNFMSLALVSVAPDREE